MTIADGSYSDRRHLPLEGRVDLDDRRVVDGQLGQPLGQVPQRFLVGDREDDRVRSLRHTLAHRLSGGVHDLCGPQPGGEVCADDHVMRQGLESTPLVGGVAPNGAANG